MLSSDFITGNQMHDIKRQITDCFFVHPPWNHKKTTIKNHKITTKSHTKITKITNTLKNYCKIIQKFLKITKITHKKNHRKNLGFSKLQKSRTLFWEVIRPSHDIMTLKGQGHVTVNKPVISGIFIVAHTWSLSLARLLVDEVNPQ